MPASATRTTFDHPITAHGAIDGQSCACTAAIQSAIDAASAAGGGRVVIPPGRWVTASLRLRSHVELHLASGATLAASRDEAAFPDLARTENLPGVIRALVWADGEEDISITGRGVLHGGGESALEGEDAARTTFRPALLFLRDCRAVLLRDARLHYSQYWTCHLMRCADVVIDGIDIRTHPRRNNADGIDPDGCRNVRISNCSIESADDALCFKSTAGDPCEDIVVSNCVLASGCAAIKLGTESIGPIRNVHITNCVVRDSHTGIALYQKDGGGFESISISNISMRCEGEFPILIDSSRRWRANEKAGEVRSVLIENVRCRGAGRMVLRGHPRAPLRDIVLRSVAFVLTGPLGSPPGKFPSGAYRSEPDPEHADDASLPFQAIIANAVGLKLIDFSISEMRNSGQGDRGIAFIRACREVFGSWSHTLLSLPPGPPVRVEDSTAVSLVNH